MFDLCKNCEERGLIINYTEGNIVCRYCGIVTVTRIIDESSEWRNFAKDSSAQGGDDPKRVGEANNDLLRDRGICTVISGNGNKDAALTRWSQRSMQTSADKTLNRGFHTIDELSLSMTLQDTITEEAKKLFKEIDERKSLKGRSHNAIIGSCIFLACRKKNNPRSIREISLQLNVDKKDILKCYSTIKKVLPMRHCTKSAAEYAKRYANELGMNEMENRYSQKLAERANELGIVTGKNPLTVASAAVYMVGLLSGNGRTYTEISDTSSIKDITIRKCFKDLREACDTLLEELPPGWKKENLTKDKN
jgi:transcription initiation factor TFIIB